MNPPELLMYWIRERWQILRRKEQGFLAPWSDDPVFQRTYFCNVRREDDKVTKWVRNFYSPYVDHPLFEYNILLARFLNWPPTLKEVGFVEEHPGLVEQDLEMLASRGEKIWGNAYVITTHGIKMPKLHYLCRNVLPAAYRALSNYRTRWGHTTCHAMADRLQEIEGVGNFLSAQVVADVKNTLKHPLTQAEDWWTFVQPGPGSLRGASWWRHNNPNELSLSMFSTTFSAIREYVDAHWPDEVPKICNQDLQNCLCEFDKYMRVRNGTGRSKRLYNGT